MKDTEHYKKRISAILTGLIISACSLTNENRAKYIDFASDQIIALIKQAEEEERDRLAEITL